MGRELFDPQRGCFHPALFQFKSECGSFGDAPSTDSHQHNACQRLASGDRHNDRPDGRYILPDAAASNPTDRSDRSAGSDGSTGNAACHINNTACHINNAACHINNACRFAFHAGSLVDFAYPGALRY